MTFSEAQNLKRKYESFLIGRPLGKDTPIF